MSSSTYGTKLAVALGGGSKYPKHVDNVGLPDHRKVTTILYLNPDWDKTLGGEIRIWGKGGLVEDVAPMGGRLLLFWSDQVVHEVLENLGDPQTSKNHRYALTIWMVSENSQGICDENHPLSSHKREHFPV